MHENFMANIGAKIKGFMRKMREVDKSVNKAAMGTDVPIDADISKAKRKMLELQAIKTALNKKIVIPIEARVDKFQKTMGRIANTMRSFGTVAGSAFGGSFVAALPSLSPIIGTMVGGVGSLASSLTAAFGGLGAFGVAAIGNAQKLGKSMEEIKKINEKIASTTDQEKINELLKQRSGIMSKLSTEQKSAMKQINKFKGAWNDFLKVTEKPVFQVFAAGLKVATSLLDKIKPIIQPVADSLTFLLNKFNSFSETKQFKSFIDFFAGRGSSAIKNWGIIAGNALNGFMELMKAFSPLGLDMENGLIGLTEKFSKWASELSNSKGFQKFVNFVKTNAPKVLDLIGNITTFIVNLGIGMAPLGSKILDLVNGFLSWTSSMMKANPIIGQIVAWVISLSGILLALVPAIVLTKTAFSGMASALFSGLGKAFNFIKPLFTNFSATAANIGSKILPALRVAFAALTGPIGIIIGVVSLLIPVFVRLWKENEKFRAGVMKAWNIIKTVFKTVVTFISNLVKTVIGALVTWWKENQDKFMAIAKKVWDTIYTVITTILKTVWGFIQQIVSNIKDIWAEHGDFIMKVAKKTWEIISTVIVSKLKMAWSVIKGVLGVIKGLFQAVWPIVSGLVKVAWGIIKTVVKSGIDFISGVIDTAMSLLKGDWKGAWDAIKGIVTDIWGNVESFFASVNLADIGRNMIEGLIGGIKEMGKSLVKSVEGVVDSAIDGAKNLLGIHSPSKVFKGFGVNTFQGYINGADKMKSKVGNAAKNMASLVTNSFKPDLALADMSASATLDTNINKTDMRSVKHAFSAEMDDFELPDKEDVVLEIDGREVGRATFKYVSEEQKREQEREERFR